MRAVAPVAIMSHNIVPPSLPSCSNNDRWPTPIKLFRQHLDKSDNRPCQGPWPTNGKWGSSCRNEKLWRDRQSTISWLIILSDSSWHPSPIKKPLTNEDLTVFLSFMGKSGVVQVTLFGAMEHQELCRMHRIHCQALELCKGFASHAVSMGSYAEGQRVKVSLRTPFWFSLQRTPTFEVNGDHN